MTAGSAQYEYNDEALGNAMKNASGVNENITGTIASKNTNLVEKNKINLEQEKAIVDKEKIFLTRARMIQVSKDKNAYKTKVIYTLLALIIFILMSTLGIYVFLKK